MSDRHEAMWQRAQELAKEDQARVDLALDGAHVGLFEWDIASNRSKWSTGFYRLHGLEPDEDASYQRWRDQVHPDDIQRIEEEIQRTVEHGDAFDADYRIVHPDGTLRWNSLRARVVRDGAGRALAMHGYCGDVTRRKVADAALIESEKMAVTGRMSAALAHEINNPLEAAYNLLYLARTTAASKEQLDLLDQVFAQLQRVSEITHQTLRFARPSRPNWVSVAEVVLSTLHLLRPKLDLSRVETVTDLRECGRLWCASGELQQILTNLLNNASEASREPRTVQIRTRSVCHGTALRITISDSGPGMSPETLLRAREPFFTTKEGSGTGLGMWVVQELVAKWKGHLSIRSSVHPRFHGTTISLLFPAGDS